MSGAIQTALALTFSALGLSILGAGAALLVWKLWKDSER